MHVDDGHLAAIVAEVDVVRDDVGLVGVDELDQLPDGLLQLLERSVAYIRRVDVYQRVGHLTLRVDRAPVSRTSLPVLTTLSLRATSGVVPCPGRSRRGDARCM